MSLQVALLRQIPLEAPIITGTINHGNNILRVCLETRSFLWVVFPLARFARFAQANKSTLQNGRPYHHLGFFGTQNTLSDRTTALSIKLNSVAPPVF